MSNIAKTIRKELREAAIKDIEHREKRFSVKVEPAHRSWYPDEFRISITHNGTQWSAITCTPDEWLKISEVVAAYHAEKERQRKVMNELTALGQEMGEYDD